MRENPIPDLGDASDGARRSCTTSWENGVVVHDLSDDFDGLISAISAMTPIGYTNISLAAEMG